MNFIIDLFKRATKGDSFRSADTATKYNDKIAQLNSQSPNQYNKLTTNSINRIQKTTATLTQSSTGGTTLPGTV
jgi:hypothetical protein